MLSDNVDDFLKFCSFVPEKEKAPRKKRSTQSGDTFSGDNVQPVLRNTQREIRNRKA
jgi:hypothetical protein